ncbi:MAG: S1 RNA-binding domain-containing protein [Lachnospiraceae bacterium]|nr:S1 RNA-binding domain-containing protein [Lachnospiraceae bacterium]
METAAEAAEEVKEAAQASAEVVTEAVEAAAEKAEEVKETVTEKAEEAQESMADYAAELEASLNKGQPTSDPIWARFEELLNNREAIKVTIDSAVKGGVVAFVDGIRAFIPASKLANGYVENLEEYKGKEVEAMVITAEEAGKKLVLSVRDVLRKKSAEAKAARAAIMAECVEGAVMEGTVDSLMDYGAFIKLDNGASGLLHVSQIAYKRVEKPADVLNKGDRITVKIIGVKDGKISLSKKALEEAPARRERAPRERKEGEDRPRRDRREKEEVFNYKETGKASTSVGDLLKGLKLDN